MASNQHGAPATKDAPSKAVFYKSSSKGNGKPQFKRWLTGCVIALGISAIFVLDYLFFSREASGVTVIRRTLGGIKSNLGFADCMVFIVLVTSPFYRHLFRRGDKANVPSSRFHSSAANFNGLPVDSNAGLKMAKRSDEKAMPPGKAHVVDVNQVRQSAVAKCNQAIDQATRDCDPDKAASLLQDFEKTGGKPGSVSYNLVIRAYAKKGDLWAAERWLSRMESSGVESTVCSYNTLLDAYAKADNADGCEAWLERMIKRGVEANVISYATTIYARARRGEEDRAEAWLRRMIAAGVEPDAVSYNSLIHACGVSGNAEGANRWIKEMEQRGLEATVTTYTAAIDACAKAGDRASAERWLERMLEAGIAPNVVTYSAVIDACAKASDLDRAEFWHDQMVSNNVKPNAHTYSAVINACAKSGNVDAAEAWLDRSEKACIGGDVVVYSSMIDACGKVGDAERAMSVFKRMQANGIRPHIVAYSALARPFAYRGSWQQVEQIAQGMAEAGVRPNEFFVYAQLLAYATTRPRQAERAEACFRAAIADGVQANDHVVGALGRAVGRARCQELTEELCATRYASNSLRSRERGENPNSGGAARQQRRPGPWSDGQRRP